MDDVSLKRRNCSALPHNKRPLPMNTSTIEGFPLPPLNKCIYCGSKDNLSDEHVIPFFLYGQWILPLASCDNCATITSRCETSVARGHFGQMRSCNKLRTRNPKK